MKYTNESIKEQVADTTPQSIIDIIFKQMERAADANKRIEKEGLVVRDMKGSVIAHPAIQIEINAQKIISDLIAKNKPSWRR